MLYHWTWTISLFPPLLHISFGHCFARGIDGFVKVVHKLGASLKSCGSFCIFLAITCCPNFESCIFQPYHPLAAGGSSRPYRTEHLRDSMVVFAPVTQFPSVSWKRGTLALPVLTAFSGSYSSAQVFCFKSVGWDWSKSCGSAPLLWLGLIRPSHLPVCWTQFHKVFHNEMDFISV